MSKSISKVISVVVIAFCAALCTVSLSGCGHNAGVVEILATLQGTDSVAPRGDTVFDDQFSTPVIVPDDMDEDIVIEPEVLDNMPNALDSDSGNSERSKTFIEDSDKSVNSTNSLTNKSKTRSTVSI